MTPRERRALRALGKKDRQALLVLSDLMVDDGDEYAALRLRTTKVIADAIDYMHSWCCAGKDAQTESQIRLLPEWRRIVVWSERYHDSDENRYRNSRFAMPSQLGGTCLTGMRCAIRPRSWDVGVWTTDQVTHGRTGLIIRQHADATVMSKTLWLNNAKREANLIALAMKLFQDLESQRADFTPRTS